MIDTHCHLLKMDAEKIIENMSGDGLSKLVTISTTVEESSQNISLCERNKNVFATVGIYPEYASATTDADLERIEELARHKKVVAIGEIGLDYHTEGYDEAAQKRIFIKQIEIADRVGLPFCIHCRGAAEDTLEILQKNKNLINHSGLMHCYSEGSPFVEKFLWLGLYISFSGNITYKKSDKSVIKKVPLDRLLVETDAPWLSPEPVRGTQNEPKNVRYVLEFIARELNMDVGELEKITEENARRFYNVKD